MPRKITYLKDNERLWSPRIARGKKLKKGMFGPAAASHCPTGFHRAPGYNHIRSSKDWCVRDCEDWRPPKSQTSGGRCQKPKSAWMVGLLKHYRATKAADPGYTFSQAMSDFSGVYKK